MKVNIERIYLEQAKSGETLENLGISYSLLTKIRQGGNVSPRTVYKLSKALDCAVEDLIVIER